MKKIMKFNYDLIFNCIIGLVGILESVLSN